MVQAAATAKAAQTARANGWPIMCRKTGRAVRPKEKTKTSGNWSPVVAGARRVDIADGDIAVGDMGDGGGRHMPFCLLSISAKLDKDG